VRGLEEWRRRVRAGGVREVSRVRDEVRGRQVNRRENVMREEEENGIRREREV